MLYAQQSNNPQLDARRVMPAIYLLLIDETTTDFPPSDTPNDTPDNAIEDVCSAWDSTFPEDAVTVEEGDRLNIQKLLDTHNVLRLSPGDYRTTGLDKVTIDSNQSIIALSPTLFPDVEVAAGATHVRLEGLNFSDLSFESGESIRYNCFKNFQQSSIIVNGATVERNLFVAFANSNLEVDTSQNGHFSDNRFIKFNTHGADQPMVIKGDSDRQSGGNAFLLTDAQTPLGSGYSIDGHSDISFVGVDLEAYNQRHATNGNDAPYAFQVRNTGTFRAIKSSGMNRESRDPSTNPGFDIDAEQIFMTQFSAPTPKPVLRVGPSNKLLFSWRNKVSSDLIQDDTADPQALRIFAQENIGPGNLEDVSLSIGETRITSEPNAQVSNALHTALTYQEAGTAAWSIPNFGDIPNPTGANWRNNLDQQVDEAAAIQAMIDSNGIAYLEPRTYYIGTTIQLDRNQGIVGAGANKTAIIALRPDINIVNLAWTGLSECAQTTSGFTLAEITLQGGLNGITATQESLQVNRSILSHVTFRDMANAGILVDGIFGWDNNVHDYLNFVDSPFGFKIIPGTNPGNSCYGVSGEYASMSYMDKTVFYRNQFVRLGTGMALDANRPNNLNGVVESLFEDNTTNAINLNGFNLGFMIASSRFVDNAGDPVIDGNFDTTVVNSYFEAGRGSSMVNYNVHVEGSTFTAGDSNNAVVFGFTPLGDFRNPRFFDISNSVLQIPLGPVDSSTNITGMYYNNDRVSGDSLSYFFTLVEFVTGGSIVRNQHKRTIVPLLRGTSSPGSQLLRGGSWAP